MRVIILQVQDLVRHTIIIFDWKINNEWEIEECLALAIYWKLT